LTPGAGFGAQGEGYFHVSAFNSRENAEEVVRRLKRLFPFDGFAPRLAFEESSKVCYLIIIEMKPLGAASAACDAMSAMNAALHEFCSLARLEWPSANHLNASRVAGLQLV
jgi:hypothetical protein